MDHSWRGLLSSATGVGVLEESSQFLDRYFEHVREFVSAGFASSFADSYVHGTVCWRPALDVPWREADTWPPPHATDYTLWATEGDVSNGGVGSLVAEQPEQKASVTWTHDPENPDPSRGHAFHELSERLDLADLVEREDVVEFRGSPLREPVECAGIATFQAMITSSAPRTTIVVTLLDQLPDGRTWEVRTGRLRIDDAAQAQEVSVNLGPVAYVFPQGHRIGVRISSSLFPRLALDSGNQTNTWVEWAPDRTEQTMELGGSGGARLSCAALPT